MKVFSEEIRRIFEKNGWLNRSNRNKIIEMRYLFIENFDLAYLTNFASNKIDFTHKNFLAIQFLQYCFIFEDREDKRIFLKEFISRIEIDKEGYFANVPEVKSDLLIIFRVEWDSLRTAGKITSEPSDIIDRLVNIEKNTSSIPELQSQIEVLINRNIAKEKRRRVKQILSYADLFKRVETGISLKDIFKKYGYTNDKGIWCGQNNVRNELAIAYYVLKEPAHGFQLVKPGDKRPQLIALYSEFGLNVSEKLDSDPYTSVRNLTTEPACRDIHDEFKRIFKPLLNP